MITDKQMQEYKQRLEKERLLLLAEIEQSEKPVDFGSDIDHMDEETDEAEEMSNQLAAANDLKRRLAEIDVALSKIRSGGYGVCENCHKPIDKEVLDIDPESPYCKNCKILMETQKPV